MPQPLKSEQADELRSNVPLTRILPDVATPEVIHSSNGVLRPSTLTSAWRPDPAENPSATRSRGFDFLPTPWLGGPVTQEAQAFPSTRFIPSDFTGGVTQGASAFSGTSTPFSSFTGVGLPGASVFSGTGTPFSGFTGVGMPGVSGFSGAGTPFSSFTGAGLPRASAFSSTGTPTTHFVGGSIPRAVELPSILEIGGFLYQRIGRAPRGDSAMVPDSHMGGLPFADQRYDHVPHLEGGYSQDRVSPEVQPDQHFAVREIQSTNPRSHQQSTDGQKFSQAPPNVEPDHGVAQDVAIQVQQVSEAQSTSEAHLYGSTSTNVQLAGTALLRSTVQNPEPQTEIIRTIEPRNESLESEPDAASDIPRSIVRRSLQPASRKRKRNSKTVSRHKSINKSAEPNSYVEQEGHQRRMTRSSQPVSANPRRKSQLLREIEAHNQSPERESELDIEILNEWKDVPLTRGQRQGLDSFLTGKPEVPQKNYNVKKLMLAQFSGIPRGTKTFYAEDSSSLGHSSHQRQLKSRKDKNSWDDDHDDDEEDGEEKCMLGDRKTKDRSHPRPISTRHPMARQVNDSERSSQRSDKSSRRKEKMATESAWSMWDSVRERISELVKAPRYSPHPSLGEKPAYRGTAKSPEGYQAAYRVEDGLHVFSPTSAAFLDFARFMVYVEEVTDRKTGVVKVIVPSDCLSQIPTPRRGTFPTSTAMKTMKISLSLHKESTQESSKTYGIFVTNDSSTLEADEVLDRIQRDQDNVTKKRKTGAEAAKREGVWKESHATEPYTEERMMRRSEKSNGAVVSALDEPATQTLRAALRCRDPRMDSLLGNRFTSSRSTQTGTNESVFHIATGPGPLVPLQMNKYAAYSLNYHHSGASRILTVTTPEHHEMVEDFVHNTQDRESLFVRSGDPPACSQFVAHQQVYVPRETLSSYGIDYTEVVQHPGEMVITFPYAYHEAYTSGPNITEGILYASDRCKIFHQENLYQRCSSSCAAGQPDDFNLEDVFANTLSSTRSGHRQGLRLDTPFTFISPRQSREPSAPHNRDADGRPSKRTSGLKNMSLIDDDWPRDLVTGRPLKPGEWAPGRRQSDNNSDEIPLKLRRRPH